MDRSRTFLLIFGVVVFLTSAQRIARYMTQASDIWWTPRALSPALSDVADRVEVYVRDVPLQEQVRSGRVQLLGDVSPAMVTESDIRFRFNNWDRVRAQEIPALLTSAAFLGASGVCLLLGVLGWIPARKASPTA
jgi:hypothetical protein